MEENKPNTLLEDLLEKLKNYLLKHHNSIDLSHLKPIKSDDELYGFLANCCYEFEELLEQQEEDFDTEEEYAECAIQDVTPISLELVGQHIIFNFSVMTEHMGGGDLEYTTDYNFDLNNEIVFVEDLEDFLELLEIDVQL